MLRRLAVTGLSMAPTLQPGDRVLVAPVWRLRRGDLVVLRDPTFPDRWVVKRVAALPGQRVRVGMQELGAVDGFVVLGDNLASSRDSRTYGPVRRAQLRGRAWYRYAPPDRAGKLSRGDGAPQ